jgi:phosphate acetyltransferase
MDIITTIRRKASEKKKVIVLPESSDIRTLMAATYMTNEHICSVILIGNESEIRSFGVANNINLPSSIKIINPEDFVHFDEFVVWFYEKRKSKGLSEPAARQMMSKDLYFASALVAKGYADGCVAGAINTTGDVLKAAFQVIGMRKESTVVSSIFLMTLPSGPTLTFGDCAVVPYPDSDQLASIATDSAQTHKQLTGEVPKVAMLSFSTKGSAVHPQVDLVKSAMGIATRKNPNLIIDAELQFDAAFVPEIGKRKAPESEVAGQANVFIFPNLDAGNISYKITERLGGATATGPIIQGLNKPMNDLSRGCSWEDIVNTVCVTCLQSD